MPGRPTLSGRAVTQGLERAGFDGTGQRGRPVKLRHSDRRVVFVPLHRELAPGTLRSLLRQARMALDELPTFL
ncbi:MAG: type II toxin-antitoxin system HicA family toxin [Actinomycetia bacterium]|nr:type II toxin-antitoxin system HicA family toxin [Actinomycetes bacterium]